MLPTLFLTLIAFIQKRYMPASHPFSFASSSAVVILPLSSAGPGGPGGALAGLGLLVSALMNGNGFVPSTAALMASYSSGEYPPPMMTALTSLPLVGDELSTLEPKPDDGWTDSPFRKAGSSDLASSVVRQTWTTEQRGM